MKILTVAFANQWILVGMLAFCLGCGSGESDQQTQIPPILGPGGEEITTGNTATGVNDIATAKANQTKEPLPGLPKMTPEEILDKMVTAYKNAKSYTDEGEVLLTGKVSTVDRTQEIEMNAPLSMSLEKPNKVLLCANQGTAICDGKYLYEFVEPLPGQVLRKPAPETITIESIFSESILADAMAQGPTQYFTWIPIQAVLLLAKDPLKTLLYNVERTELLPPGSVENRPCHKVAIYRGDRKAIFWIDAESFVLRRFECPVKDIEEGFRRGKVENLRVVADFHGAKLDSEIEERTFSFQVPKKMRVVESLAPLSIYMLGRPAPDFFFRMVDGKPVTLKSLAGKTVVINFWASWSTQCQGSLHMMKSLFEKIQGNDRIAILSCCIDRKKISDEEIKKMLESLNVSLPIYRDEDGFARRNFLIPGVPTIVVIGPDGIIQDYQTQIFSQYRRTLWQTVQAVSEGIDIYKQKLVLFDHLRANYEKIFKCMLDEDLYVDPESIAQTMPIPGVAFESDPQKMRLYPIWTCEDVGIPGNITVLNDVDPPRILVCHDARAVAELDEQGSVVKNYQFSSLPPEAAITNIRPGKTAEGKRFYVGFAPNLQHLFLLDENFEVKWSFPKLSEQGAPGGIADVRVGDLTGDGTPEIYVAYLGDAGVKAISLRGKVLWSTREVTGVTRMAIEPPTTESPSVLLCTTNQASLIGLDGKGKAVKRFDLGDRRLYWIDVAQFDSSKKTDLCGLSAPGIGKNEALGITPGGDLTWAYQLPNGTPGLIINRVATGRFFSSRGSKPLETWILLGADSSIHFISESGELIDRFNYGSFVAGMATVRSRDHDILLISSVKGVEALSVSLQQSRHEMRHTPNMTPPIIP